MGPISVSGFVVQLAIPFDFVLTSCFFLLRNNRDASRPSVDRALSQGSRIGLAPGGIAEMFEGYPKHLTHPDDEYTIVRKGIMRMAIKHGVPIIPVYCFGSTKLMKRLQLPDIVERISLLLRVSLVVFFGKWGLPMPFRQKLLYVMGQPIFPPETANGENSILDQQVDEMQSQFCEELVRIFDRHKESYGWGHKSLLTLTR
jgi:1-acyl-sn-glycerol-3-phosphate acyltransferase